MNYPRFYTTISAFWRKSDTRCALLAGLDKALVGLIAAGYGTTLVWLLSRGDIYWVRVAVVPAFVLVLVTVLRTVINAARPYELYDITPLIPTSTQGHSLPSRHVTSAFIIACALGYVNLTWGLVAAIAACLVAYTRVASGVHFMRDVIAGALLALVCGALGFLL